MTTEGGSGKSKGPVVEGFVPRKEFTREQRNTSSFSLLAISGNSLIRLYSFTPETINAIRNLLDRLQLITAFREVVGSNLCEFTLDGKPWSNPKSMTSEALLVYIMAVIYDHGWEFLSTIDYGRDPDDRVAIAFSKPSPSSSPLSSPLSSLQGNHVPTGYRKVPFAVSFQSATTMRVINPPLNNTPAILQAVRGAWPRGVDSEKKVGDSTYIFKLKGYKWFQEDTFAADSLRYILSLLATLDKHAFTLLTSISLTNRSRIKDLWIFTGLVPINEPSTSTPTLPQMTLPASPKPSESGPGLPAYDESPFPSTSIYRHVKQSSAPPTVPGSVHPIADMHARAATSPQQYPTRPAYPIQAPSGPIYTTPKPPTPQMRSPYPTPSPSKIKAQVPATESNMAGVGSGGVKSPHSPEPTYPTPAPSKIQVQVPTVVNNMAGVGSGGITLQHSPESTETLHGPDSYRRDATAGQPASPGTPSWIEAPEPQDGLLAGAFQGDIERQSFTSALSDDSDISRVIPVNWVGAGTEPERPSEPTPATTAETKAEPAPSLLGRTSSIGPQLPGGWLDSPVVEKARRETDLMEETPRLQPVAEGSSSEPDSSAPEDEIREVDNRVSGTDFQVHEADVKRMSESGIVGTTTPIRQSMVRARTPDSTPKKLVKREASGHGWVVLDPDDTPSIPAVEFPANGDPAVTPTKKPFELVSGSKMRKDSKVGNEGGGLKQLLSFSKRPADSVDSPSNKGPDSTTEDRANSPTPDQANSVKATKSRFRDRFRVGSSPDTVKPSKSKS